MGRTKSASGERVFTVELNSRNNVREVSAPNESQKVAIEGTIGSLQRACFVEDTVLELTGSGGVLRVDLSKEELIGAFQGTGRGASKPPRRSKVK